MHKKRNCAKATPEHVPANEKDWVNKRRQVVTSASMGSACSAEHVGDDMVSRAQSLTTSLWTTKHTREDDLQQGRLHEGSGPLSLRCSKPSSMKLKL